MLSRFVSKFLKNDNHFIAYGATVMAYSGASRFDKIKDATVYTQNKKGDYVISPMLIRDKVTVVLLGSVIGFELWPIYLWRDIGKLERRLRHQEEFEERHYSMFNYLLLE